MREEERPSVIRKIYFYRVHHFGSDGQKETADASAILQQVSALRYDNGQAYFQFSDGHALCAWSAPGGSGRLILGTVRSRGLSEIEERGQRSSLTLSPRQNLLECTHAMFFND